LFLILSLIKSLGTQSLGCTTIGTFNNFLGRSGSLLSLNTTTKCVCPPPRTKSCEGITHLRTPSFFPLGKLSTILFVP